MIALSRRTSVLITGVTGLLGGEILRELLKRHMGGISALIRPGSFQSAQSRFEQRMARSGEQSDYYSHGVLVMEGDISRQQWNLSPSDFRYVTDHVETIIHCAADTSFIRGDSVIDTNIQGTKNLIALVRSMPNPPRIVYISTATNVGCVRHCCLREEQGCQAENQHHNSYTQSKAIAESMLRESGLDVLVIRPTIVLSGGLSDAAFARSILWFAPLLYEFDALPIDPTSEVDLISSTFMAKSTIELLLADNLAHDCYHISAGHRHSVTCREVLETLDRYYGRKPPQLIAPEQWTMADHRQFIRSPEQRKVFHALRYYLPFLNMDVTYDDSRLYQALGSQVPEFQEFNSYSDQLLSQIGINEAMVEAARP